MSISNTIYKRITCILVLSLLSGSVNAANAQSAGNPPLLGGAGGSPVAVSGSWTMMQGRQNYFYRNPRAAWAHQNDSMQTINGNSLGPSSSANTTDNDAIPDKTATDSSETAPPSGSNPQVNAQQSTGPGGGAFEAYHLLDPRRVPPYGQPELVSPVTTPIRRDQEMFQMPMQTNGYPLSDTQYQLIDREDKQRFMELLFDPERMLWIANLWAKVSQGSVGNSFANASQSSFTNATNEIMQPNSTTGGAANGGIPGITAGFGGSGAIGSFINVANDSNMPVAFGPAPMNQTVQGAVAMVQALYKNVFVPMALLFLLPGAVITQMRAQITQSFSLQSDEAGSPFEGILRAMIALFLIPATQLIISYSTDVGNSLAYTVGQFVQQDIILGWANELAYAPPPSMFNNAIIPPSSAAGSGTINSGMSSPGLTSSLNSLSGDFGAGNFAGAISAILSLFGNYLGYSDTGQGLAANQPPQQVHLENQSSLSQMLQLIFNVATTMFSTLIIIATGFQIVFMCYLYLLGPLAAAFYAWPKLSPTAFRDIFGNWLVAVIQLSLWRFYWMVILAVMTTRLVYIQRTGAALNLQWEIAIFACFVGLMFYVPMSPWTFDAGSTFSQVASIGSYMVSGPMMSQIAQQMQQEGFSPAQIQQFESTVQSVTTPMMGIATQQYDANLAAHPGSIGDIIHQESQGGPAGPGGGSPPPSSGYPGSGGGQAGYPPEGAPQATPTIAPSPAVPPPPAATPAATQHAEINEPNSQEQEAQAIMPSFSQFLAGSAAQEGGTTLGAGGSHSSVESSTPSIGASGAPTGGDQSAPTAVAFNNPVDRGPLAGNGQSVSSNPSVPAAASAPAMAAYQDAIKSGQSAGQFAQVMPSPPPSYQSSSHEASKESSDDPTG